MGTGEIPTVKKLSRVASFRLKQERERHGWTQNQVAENVGTTQTNVSRWETGETVPGPYYRQKLGQLFGKTLEELGFVLEVEGESSEQDEQAIATFNPQMQNIWNIPYRRNPFFTGREELLDQLHHILTKNKFAALTQAQAISGLGGIGKTQIAVEYAYRYSESYSAFLWIAASSRGTLIADFMALADLLRLPERDEQNQDAVISAVKRWLATHKNWLLIIDNVDDPKAVFDILPMQTRGKVLLTTRLQALGPLAQSIEVEKMAMREGLLFLLRRTKVLLPDAALDELTDEEQIQAAKIVTVLDGLPLALDHAGAYIEETQCGFVGYLDLYRTRRKELLQKRRTSLLLSDHPESVATTWSLSFQKVEKESTVAADLLHLFAFLYPDAIPEEVITEGAGALDPILSKLANNPVGINNALGTLLRYSLIRRHSEAKLLSIHRLVQVVVRDGMQEDLQRTWAERTIRAIARAFPKVELKTWDQCRRLLPHALISLEYIDEYVLAFPEAVHLFNKTAMYLVIHAQYTQAQLLLQKALDICQQILASTHPDTAITLNDLGTLYLIQGNYQQSEPLLLNALTIREQVLGSEHPETATSLDNLGALYSVLGKYKLAEEFYQRAFKIRQYAFEPNHPDIALSLKHLAELHTIQGEYEKAKGLYLQALAIQEQVLGLNHPDVAKTLNDLAQLYRAQGEYVKAEPLYQSALSIRKNFFGPNHPYVAQSHYSLARLYLSQGKYPLAEEYCQEAWCIQEQQLGANHPDIADTLSTLAKIYQVQENFNEAELLYKRALTIRESTTGSDHPHVAFIISSLGEVFQAQGKYQEADPLIRRSLAIRIKSLGEQHPYIAYCLSNLAENYYLQKDYVQAGRYFKEALAIREQVLGFAHPQTASAYHNLAKLSFAQGQYKEAESLFQKTLEIREQSLGPEHPDVATNLEHYANLMRTMKREDMARKFETRAQVIRAKYAKPTS